MNSRKPSHDSLRLFRLFRTGSAPGDSVCFPMRWSPSVRAFLSLHVGRHVDDAHGALLHAQLAALTLILVDVGHIVLHGDGIEMTHLGTLHAADTTGGAGLAGLGALVLVLAGHHRLTLVLGDHADDVVGAGSSAGAAAGALLTIHLGDAVHDVDGIEGAGPGTIAVAQAAVLAHTVAAVQALDGLAALDALKLVLLGGLVAGAGAGHDSLHGHGSLSSHTHDLRDGSHGGGAAGSTLVDRVTVFHDALGIVGTARAAAGAAVGAGQHAGDLLHPLIHGHVHEDGGSHQDDRADQADDGNQNDCHDNRIHILLSLLIKRRRWTR